MQRLKAKRSDLDWACQHRALAQQKAQQDAVEKARLLENSKTELTDAGAATVSAAERWLGVAAEGGTIDPLLGQLWQAEFDRCRISEANARQRYTAAVTEVEKAAANLAQRTIQVDRLREDLRAVDRKIEYKIDEVRLAETTELLAVRKDFYENF